MKVNIVLTPDPYPVQDTYLTGLLRGALRGGGGRRRGQSALPLPISISVDQFAVGLLQGPLELIDAGLVLQQDILWLVQELGTGGGRGERYKMNGRAGKGSTGKIHLCPPPSHPNAVILIITQGAKGARMMNSKRCTKQGQGQGHMGDKEDRLMKSPSSPLPYPRTFSSTQPSSLDEFSLCSEPRWSQTHR